MKILKIVIVVILAVIFTLGVFFAGLGYGVFYTVAPKRYKNSVTVDIPKGSTVGEIGKKLEKAGVIRSAFLFKSIITLTKSSRELKPGLYVVKPQKNIMDIIFQIKQGKGVLNLVTVPEGLTVNQIAKLIEKVKIAKYKDFIKATKSGLYTIDGVKVKNIEGYLLPDTYDFPSRYGASEVIDTMISSFNRKVVPLYYQVRENLPFKMSIHNVVTLASLVEREAQIPSERPIIAMVYYNRLKKGMPLQCDATIQYILGKQKKYLTYKDLKIKSPYNTYLYKGLPPGPIANPGIDSIKAVLKPIKVDYLFYVRNDLKNDGSHIFSKTYRQHKESISKYQK